MNNIQINRKFSLSLPVIILGVMCLLHFPAAFAGVFSVTPVRIFMSPKDRAVAITIENTGDETLIMQTDLYEWKQKDNGEDDLTLTEDLLLAPPILKMAPKSKQVVRLARLNPISTDKQLTYRMVVREVPEALSQKQDMHVQIALAFSMPVFITPANVKAHLECTIERLKEDTVNAVCINSGTAYAQPRDFQLSSTSGDTLASREQAAYVLPGVKRSFELKREGATIPSGPARLSLALDDGTTKTFEVTIP